MTGTSVCESAIGASLTLLITMLTVASTESTVPSFTRKVKLSAPVSLSAGV